jgi:hypothetical protein
VWALSRPQALPSTTACSATHGGLPVPSGIGSCSCWSRPSCQRGQW